MGLICESFSFFKTVSREIKISPVSSSSSMIFSTAKIAEGMLAPEAREWAIWVKVILGVCLNKLNLIEMPS